MKMNLTSNARYLPLIAGSLLAAGQLPAQIAITGGNLYVYQSGDGITTAASGVGAPLYIDQFSPSANGLIGQTALPTTAGVGVDFLAIGQSATDGGLSYNASANVLVFGGYSGPAVNSSISSSSRDLGQVNASGTFSFAVQNSAQYNGSGGQLRSATTDGSGNYWAAGSAPSGGQGIWYYGNNGSATALTGSSSPARDVAIYGGDLFYTTGAGLNMIAGSPQSGTQTPTSLFAAGSTPYGFTLSPNMLTAYVANESGGIIKAVYSGAFSSGIYSGGTWSTTTIDSGTKFDWLTADFSGANPVIYATTLASSTGNSLDEIVDNGGSDPATTLDTITGTSADSANYDGIVFVPVSAPEPSAFALAGLGLLLWVGKFRRTNRA